MKATTLITCHLKKILGLYLLLTLLSCQTDRQQDTISSDLIAQTAPELKKAYMIAYRLHPQGAQEKAIIPENNNLADAAGQVKFITENTMGLQFEKEAFEITAFKITWTYPELSKYRGLNGIYKECNKGTCSPCGLLDNTNMASRTAFGSLLFKTGGYWFSFETQQLCVENGLPICFSYEKIGTVGRDDIAKIISLGKGEAASRHLQEAFEDIPALLQAGYMDSTTFSKSTLESAFSNITCYGEFGNNDNWDDD